MIADVLNDADNSLFEGIMKNCNHVLHAYLPERRDSSNKLRQHSHNRTFTTITT